MTNNNGDPVIDSDALENLLDYMEEEYDIERSERAREIGRRMAHLRD